MELIEQEYHWKWVPEKRRETNTIILHHSAGTGSAEDIHRMHQAQGWPGIGYHFYVRKNGRIYRGRPEEQIGTHTAHYNAQTIGICFEGNFERDTMHAEQYEAGVELLQYLLGKYGPLEVKKHRDFNATACPGRNFPFDEMKEEASVKRYNKPSDMPDWAKPTINKLIENGFLAGNGNNLDLTEDMMRLLVINDRAGVYGK